MKVQFQYHPARSIAQKGTEGKKIGNGERRWRLENRLQHALERYIPQDNPTP